MSPSAPLNRRQWLSLSTAGLATAAAGAGPNSKVTGLAPADTHTLQIVGPWEIGGLAPSASGYIFTRLQVAETLLGALDDGSPQPGLARRWHLSADGLVWRFELRSGARFHDGSPVTAQAVVRCLQAARTAPALLSQAPIEAIVAEGPGTVVIKLGKPFASLSALLAHSSTLVLAPSSYRPDGSVQAIIASGPYQVSRISAPQQVETRVFEGFDGPRPAIGRVRYLVASRSETRALMAESGQADLAYALDPASMQRLRRRGKVRVETVTLPRTMVLKLNAGLPSLSDLRVRQALSLAIDRRGIAMALLREPDLAATQLFAPTLARWHDEALSPLTHDPQQAARLLEQAGWQRAGGGWQNAQGQPLALELRTFPDRPELPLVATALQAQWRELGIELRVSIGNSGDIPLGHRNGSLQCGLAARHYGTVPDPVGTLAQDFGPAGGDWGAMGWRSLPLETALAQLQRGGQTPAQQARLRRTVTTVLHQELPVIPIAWYRQQVAVGARLEGVSLDPLERSYRLSDMRWRT